MKMFMRYLKERVTNYLNADDNKMVVWFLSSLALLWGVFLLAASSLNGSEWQGNTVALTLGVVLFLVGFIVFFYPIVVGQIEEYQTWKRGQP
jgi:hypothetical protein